MYEISVDIYIVKLDHHHTLMLDLLQQNTVLHWIACKVGHIHLFQTVACRN